jgi:DNA-binding transcriptional ArsR family regulator
MWPLRAWPGSVPDKSKLFKYNENFAIPQQNVAMRQRRLPARAYHPSGVLTSHIDIHKHIEMNKDYSRTISAAWRRTSRVFTALGDEHRQRILLTFEPGERLNVGQIAEVSTLSRSAVSHHLKTLREAGVLRSAKEGKEVYYWIDKAFVGECLRSVLDYLETKA